MSFEVILPFLKPIKHLLEADTVCEIMLNPDRSLEVIANRLGMKLVWTHPF
jgi:Flp pilus assembly CpaF family ATPase